MKKIMKKMVTLGLSLCMAVTIVSPVNAARRNQNSKKINGYVLTTRAELENVYHIMVVNKHNVKVANWSTQAEYKGPKDNGKLTTSWKFSSPDGVQWDGEGQKGSGKITGGSKTLNADVVTATGAIYLPTNLAHLSMESAASFKKGNTLYSVTCKN